MVVIGIVVIRNRIGIVMIVVIMVMTQGHAGLPRASSHVQQFKAVKISRQLSDVACLKEEVCQRKSQVFEG